MNSADIVDPLLETRVNPSLRLFGLRALPLSAQSFGGLRGYGLIELLLDPGGDAGQVEEGVGGPLGDAPLLLLRTRLKRVAAPTKTRIFKPSIAAQKSITRVFIDE